MEHLCETIAMRSEQPSGNKRLDEIGEELRQLANRVLSKEEFDGLYAGIGWLEDRNLFDDGSIESNVYQIVWMDNYVTIKYYDYVEGAYPDKDALMKHYNTFTIEDGEYYGYRVWIYKPSEEQMQAVEWNNQDKTNLSPRKQCKEKPA